MYMFNDYKKRLKDSTLPYENFSLISFVFALLSKPNSQILFYFPKDALRFSPGKKVVVNYQNDTL